MTPPLAPVLRIWLAAGEPAIVATVAQAAGSTPREEGAVMIVARHTTLGSIGGGQLEFHAIDRARAMMASGEARRELDLPLGPHLGQCCGGRVVVALERAGEAHVAALAKRDEEMARRAPHLLILGAGHTGRALAHMAAALPARVALIDDRDGVFDNLPEAVDRRRLDDPGEAIAQAPPRAAYVILTHSHALDYRLADAALRRGDAAYVGMIGSSTKRARFERWFLQSGGTRDMLKRFTCPIGGAGVCDKRPEVIAALTLGEAALVLFAAAPSAQRDIVGDHAA